MYRYNNADTTYVEFTLQEIVDELKTNTCVETDQPDPSSNVYFRNESGAQAHLKGLPMKDCDGKDLKRPKTVDDMKEFWHKKLGLQCKCYEGKETSECLYFDKDRVVELRDTIVIDMANCLSRPLPFYDEEVEEWRADFSTCLNAKVWPENIDQIVKIDYKNWYTKKIDTKYFRLFGMILKGSSQDVLEGHYMSAVKLGDDKWFHIDDESVQPLVLAGPFDHRETCYPTHFMLKAVPAPIPPTTENK